MVNTVSTVCRFPWGHASSVTQAPPNSRTKISAVMKVFMVLAWLSTCTAEKQTKHILTLDEFDELLNDIRIRREVSIDYSAARVRRESGDVSYEYNNDNEEETGPWGEWGQPGPCSRTCGGGVATEERQCTAKRSDECTGSNKRFSSCNINPCGRGAKDFREQQCAEYNNILFERKYHDWIPYLKAPRKCELNCMPKGERFYNRHAKKVLDGTSCDDTDRRICVDGECLPVGCDGMLGSNTEEDNCRVCGGDGSTCEMVRDTLNNQDLVMGYNDLLLIPAGATNIKISEVKASNNYLALRNTTGHYYLNGNWRIDFPQQMDIAGTTFHYEKKLKNKKGLTFLAPESIRALGPTSEAIYIVILYQEKNPGIEFEYSLKKDAVRETPVGRDGGYQWTMADWGDCNAPCGGGIRSRDIFCSATATFEKVPSNLCDPVLRPPKNETCNPSPCKPKWKVGDWGNCTEGNGTDCTQFQFRNVYCEQILANNVPSLVDEEECIEALGDAPLSIKNCDEELEDDILAEDDSGPKYHIGPWTGCSKICGDGIRTREVTCYKKDEDKTEVLDDSECMGIKPKIEEECENDHPCEAVDWVISDFSTCDGICGLIHQSRHAICTDSEGKEVAKDKYDLCDTALPELVVECEVSEKFCEFSWFASQWSQCSSKCSDVNGVQSRVVFCGSVLEDGTISNVTDENCDEEFRYEETRECNGTEECSGTWYQSNFGSCTTECGGGTYARMVFCIKDGKKVAPDQCDANIRPMEEVKCNEDPCPVNSGDGSGEDDRECEYYDDWWILGGSGDKSLEDEELIVEDSVEDAVVEEGGSGDGSGNGDKKKVDLSGFSKRCKPEPVKSCSNTTYGCCPDEFFAATGPFNEDCNEYKTCEDTRYGCCKDGFSTAKGPQFSGCNTTQCDDTLYGCCDDGETPKDGEGSGDEDGCEENKLCKAGKFGCCPDGKTFAQGPKKQGCYTCPEEIYLCDDCAKTEFGCCPDLENAAAGPEFQGCPDEEGSGIYEDCTLTEYGCCPDGLTKAKGLEFKGCENATPCKDAKWGCCEDLFNPAHGPNKEGCCLNTEFGCCPDNTLPAKGLENEGCSCEVTEHGCCPDDISPARGPDFAGCGCISTENGCCPDKFTPSPGPDQAFCPCNTFEYGCCPDGESIARGPGQEGCTCKDTEFGCCEDRRTPAEGPDREGCDCAATLYGCCPDGNMTAEGENFLGCEGQELPEPPAEVCGLEKNRGPSRNFTVRWFFDMDYGGCSRFWYGGEEGNRNNFETKEECNAVCVDPVGKKACNLPTVPGPCEGYYPRYAYKPQMGVCEQFNYGGCLGNNNKFKSQAECDDTCVENEFTLLYKDKCEQPIEEGPCAGNFSRWGYNQESEECEEFNYGGCKGNLNSFQTQTECINSCTKEGRSRDMCLLPRAPGPCQDRIPMWYFDNSEKRCMPFYYGGCEGNGNRYESEEDCRQSCPSEFLQADICKLEKEVGPCRDLAERYYFDKQGGTCQKFYFGGCLGNKNNFLTLEDCQGRCSVDYSIPIDEEFKLEFCFLGKDPGQGSVKQTRYYYDHETGVCESFTYGGKKGNGNRFLTRQHCETSCTRAQDVCELPKVIGPCSGSMEQYFYDKDKDECFSFKYGGCQGNGNKFDTKVFCEKRCLKGTGPRRPEGGIAPGVNICGLPLDTGPCTDSKPAWYYDEKKQSCTAFTYGGCEGNANRYETEEQCERQCGKFKNQDICSMEMDYGPCLGRFKKYYYNKRQKSCEQFTFGGCEGNGNRFSSITECEKICLNREEPEISDHSTVSKKAICQLPLETGHESCNEDLKRWYFKSDVKQCHPFMYTGCAGNQNRFKNFDVCMGFCEDLLDVKPPGLHRQPDYTERPIDLDYRDPESDQEINKNCDESEQRCQSYQCPYGTRRYFDDRTQCEECFCNEPCYGHECPAETTCQVELYEARGETIYRAICKDDTKEGICPKVNRNEYASCEEECQTDGICPGEQKCCYNGCGKSCMKASMDPSPVEYDNDLVEAVDPNAPIIEVVEPYIIASEGDVAELPVRVSGNPSPDVYWRKERRNIDTTRGKFKILPGGSLQIVGVRNDDAGSYSCFADNGHGPPIEEVLYLQVDAPREIPARIVETEPNLIMSLAAPASLYCLAYGYPRPTVTWWRDMSMLPIQHARIYQDQDYTLNIRSVALSDLGPYTCQAYNGLGEAASYTVEMRAMGPVHVTSPADQKYLNYVEGTPEVPRTTTTILPGYRPTRPPGWDYNTPPPSTTQSPDRPRAGYITASINMAKTKFPLNARIHIPCEVNSYNRPTVKWGKNGQQIIPDSRVVILRANNTLAIYGARTEDTATFTCYASNGYNDDEASVSIHIENVEVAEGCDDNPYFANCKLIVKARYCGNKYYAKFCCRSCTMAGHL